MERMYRIYIIKNTVNDKVYIGQTCNTIQERFYQHTKPSVLKQRSNYKIYNAINKYGVDKFYVELLEDNIPLDKIDEKEIFYIQQFDSYHNGYNSTLGGDAKTLSSVEDLDKLTQMFQQKSTYQEMAQEFKVNKATIARTIHALGLKRKKRIEKDFLLQNKDNMTNIEIAKHYDVSEASVTRAFQRYGIRRGKGCSNHLSPQNQKTNKV